MHSGAEIESKLQKAWSYYEKTRHGGRSAVEDRFEKLNNMGKLLESRAPEYAKIMTEEMGKPLS